MIYLYIILSLIIVYIIWGLFYSFKVEELHYQLKENKISKIKSNDGYKIVYFSDLHLGKAISKRKLEKYVAYLSSLKADLYIFGGDFIGYKYSSYTLDQVKEIFKPFKDLNIIGVYGNHEYKKVIDTNLVDSYLQASNIKFLRNETLNFHNLAIYMQEETIYHPLQIKEAKGLVIIHEGDNFDLIDGNYLMLSGHTHGGQIRPFPFYLYLPKQGKRYKNGLFTKENKSLIVSKGIGNSLFDFRFFCRKDIIVIDYIEK